MGESCKGLGVGKEALADDTSAVGDSTSRSVIRELGILCGRGDMSMTSIAAAAGDEEGSGGVVMVSSLVSIYKFLATFCRRPMKRKK